MDRAEFRKGRARSAVDRRQGTLIESIGTRADISEDFRAGYEAGKAEDEQAVAPEAGSP